MMEADKDVPDAVMPAGSDTAKPGSVSSWTPPAVTAALLLSAAGPIYALIGKHRIAIAGLLALALVALVWAAWRRRRGSQPGAAVLRRSLLLLAAGQAMYLIAALLALGLAWVNLDSLHDERLHFHLLITVPLCVGLLAAAIAMLPPVARANLILFLILWAATEAIFGKLLPSAVQGDPQSLLQPEYWQADSRVGYTLVPNNRALHIKTLERRPVISATYVIDRFGRRATLPDSCGRNEFLLLFGDSNTFGEGVAQTETIPYQLALRAPRYQPYNYALSGYGPAQALDLVKSRDLRTEVAQAGGLALYFFLPTLLDRVRGGSTVSAGWGRHFSAYEVAPDGRLVRTGDFVHAHPLRTLFYYLVGCSNVAAYFELALPRTLDPSTFDLTARILAEMRRLLESQLNIGGFYVVLVPVSAGEAPISRRLIPYLKAQDLPYLDLTAMFDASRPGYRLPDYHLSPLSDRLIAQRLAVELKLAAPPPPADLRAIAVNRANGKWP